MNPAQAAAAPQGSSARETDGHIHLAAGGPGENLAERYQVGKTFITQPPAAHHIRVAEVAEVRNRSAKRGEPQTKGDCKHFEDRAARIPGGTLLAVSISRNIENSQGLHGFRSSRRASEWPRVSG